MGTSGPAGSDGGIEGAVRLGFPLGAGVEAFASGLGFDIDQRAKTFVCRSSKEPNLGATAVAGVDRNFGAGGALCSIAPDSHEAGKEARE
jgi:hypothetical protein